MLEGRAAQFVDEMVQMGVEPLDARAEVNASVDRFLYYPSENHWVLTPQHAKVWYQVVTAFLARHVLGEDVELPEILG